MEKIKTIIAIVAIIGLCCFMVDLARFPECYLTTWRYQLENDIKQGNAKAIEYYNRVYVDNGRTLFND